MDNEIILNETNSGSVSSYHFVRVRCLFISCQGKKSPLSRQGTRMTRIGRIYTDNRMSSRAHSPPFVEVIAPRLYYEPPHRTGLEDFPHPALQKHIL